MVRVYAWAWKRPRDFVNLGKKVIWLFEVYCLPWGLYVSWSCALKFQSAHYSFVIIVRVKSQNHAIYFLAFTSASSLYVWKTSLFIAYCSNLRFKQFLLYTFLNYIYNIFLYKLLAKLYVPKCIYDETALNCHESNLAFVYSLPNKTEEITNKILFGTHLVHT